MVRLYFSILGDLFGVSLEDIYPDDVEKYGHLRVGITDLYVKDNYAVYGVVTRGEYRELTSRLLRDETVQMIISAKLAALPIDYDPWIRRIERNRALHARYGENFDPWGELDTTTAITNGEPHLTKPT